MRSSRLKVKKCRCGHNSHGGSGLLIGVCLVAGCPCNKFVETTLKSEIGMVRAWAVIWNRGFGRSDLGKEGIGQYMIFDTKEQAKVRCGKALHLKVVEVSITLTQPVGRKG